jgi:hypothetical protein
MSASVATISDIVQELRGTTSDNGQTFAIYDQIINSANIAVYLNEATAWLISQEPQAYGNSSFYVQQVVRRLEIHYVCAHLLGTMYGFIITDGHTLSVNGINQSRFQAKSEGYKGIIQHYIDGIPALWESLNPRFFVATPTNAEGQGIYGQPTVYWGYAPSR